MLFLRSLIFNVLGYGTLAVGCIVTSVIGIFSKKATIKLWTYMFLPFLVFCLKYVAGITIEVRGKQYIQNGPALYASKHESALETYIMSTIVKDMAFVLKKELTYIPIFGWAQYFYGMVAVDRSAGGAAMKGMLRNVKQRIAEGRSVIIFPEGTRMKAGTCGEYKPGLVFLAQNLDVPVVPVALNTGLVWAKKSFLRRRGKVIIEFLEPLPKGLDKKEFMSLLQQKIESKCQVLNQETVKNYPNTAKNLVKG
ncbi:MAG: 1-acyl-sn-glycerol-3-phosphate acyltransferase [Alphaproteobacteria bacterium]|nr:1-acyl-sn-glycerol-3-phosphate acyltransferase [Alphaproteobacteria bacterium]